MAGIDVGTKSGSRKSVDAMLPLVPFIDLFLCCIMFLLVTAVWNELASVEAQQRGPGDAADQLPSHKIELVLSLTEHGFVVATTAGDRHEIPRIDGKLDIEALSDRLDGYRRAYPDEHGITVVPDDGIPFESVITTMDTAKARGFSKVEL